MPKEVKPRPLEFDEYMHLADNSFGAILYAIGAIADSQEGLDRLSVTTEQLTEVYDLLEQYTFPQQLSLIVSLVGSAGQGVMEAARKAGVDNTDLPDPESAYWKS